MERTLSFTIPKEDYELPDDVLKIKYSENELPLVKNMSASVNGHLY